MDAEIGRVIPQTTHVRFYLGAYFFAPKDSKNIQGAAARLTLPISHYLALEGRDTYDNLNHNTALVDLRLTLGGIKDDQSSTDVETRLLNPIERNLGTQYTGVGLPVVNTQQTLIPEAISKTNVYFFTNQGGIPFDPAQGTNNCTFEHPCNNPSFNQTTLNDINGFTPDAQLYFNNPGAIFYNANPQINIPNGQSLWGRTVDYQAAALDNDRPAFQGSFNLLGRNSLNNLNMDGTGYTLAGNTNPLVGIEINGVSDVQLNHVGILHYHGADGADSFTLDPGENGQAAVGIDVQNAQNIHLTAINIDDITAGNGGNGSIGETPGGNGGSATGINIAHSSSLSINTVTVSSLRGGNGGTGGGTFGGAGGGNGGSTTGINISHSSFLSINTVTVSSLTSGNGGQGGAGMGIGGGDGGNGGSATGINIIDHSSSLTINTVTVSSLTSGNGGDGGGGVGNGGNGGNGGSTTGINIDDHSSSLSINGVTASLLTSGNGGIVGGDFANGGDGGSTAGISINNSSSISINNVTASSLISGNGTSGGDGNSGGDGGDGGSTIGVNINNSSFVSINNVTASSLTGGNGGDGGPGASSGGDGGDGGSAFGVRANNSNTGLSISNVMTSGLIAGNGGLHGSGPIPGTDGMDGITASILVTP